MTYPSHFPIGLAHYCENCGAVTNAETACPCCTSSRLHPLPASIIPLILAASTDPAPAAPDPRAPAPELPRETEETEAISDMSEPSCAHRASQQPSLADPLLAAPVSPVSACPDSLGHSAGRNGTAGAASQSETFVDRTLRLAEGITAGLAVGVCDLQES